MKRRIGEPIQEASNRNARELREGPISTAAGFVFQALNQLLVRMGQFLFYGLTIAAYLNDYPHEVTLLLLICALILRHTMMSTRAMGLNIAYRREDLIRSETPAAATDEMQLPKVF